jgi:hypothetical protein
MIFRPGRGESEAEATGGVISWMTFAASEVSKNRNTHGQIACTYNEGDNDQNS